MKCVKSSETYTKIKNYLIINKNKNMELKEWKLYYHRKWYTVKVLSEKIEKSIFWNKVFCIWMIRWDDWESYQEWGYVRIRDIVIKA